MLPDPTRTRPTRSAHGPMPALTRDRCARNAPLLLLAIALLLAAWTAQGLACTSASGDRAIRSVPTRRPGPAFTPEVMARGVIGPAKIEPELVILCMFSDRDSTTRRTDWDAPMFGPYVLGGRSHRDYYHEVSYYQAGVRGLDLPPANETCPPANDGIVGWYTIAYTDPDSGQTYSQHPDHVYPDGWEQTKASHWVAMAAMAAADPDVNFAAYDTDGNGRISSDELHITIILAGYEGSYGNSPTPDTWRHHWSLNPGIVLDGMLVGDGNWGGGYSMLGELDPNGNRIEYGLICHETGHDLGLPDLYDVSQNSEGIGEWGLMGSGDWCNTGVLGDCPAHIDPYHKAVMKWLAPTVVHVDQLGVTIPQVETNPVVYQLWSRGQPGNEYFLVENRQRTGYDQGLVRKEAADGLVIWHINYLREAWGNIDETRKFIDVECADGLAGHIVDADDLDSRANRGDSKDPWYQGNDADFLSTSAPDNRDYRTPNNFNSSVEVRNVSASGNPMTADLLVGRTTYIGSGTWTANGQSSQFGILGGANFLRAYFLGWNCCGNVDVYEKDNAGAWVKRTTWCFNVPRHPAFQAGQEVRQTQAQTTGQFKLTSYSLCGNGCDEAGDAGFDVDVYDNGGLGLVIPGNGHDLGGWGIGFRDGSGDEFGVTPWIPDLGFPADAEGIPLTTFPRRAGGTAGVQNLHLDFQVEPNVFWERMQLHFTVSDVARPGALAVSCPYAQVPTQTVMISAPGEYAADLGWIRPPAPDPAAVEITLGAGSPTSGASFGWDWLELRTRVAPIDALLPADGALTADATPLFDWTDLYAAGSYEFQVDDDPLFASPGLDLMMPASMFTPPAPLDDRLWYWRARGQSPGGWSDWSVPRRLRIDTHPPELTGTTLWEDTGAPGPYRVVSTITDTGTQVDSASLYFRLDGGTWSRVRMTSGEAGGAVYAADITGAQPGSAIDYYVAAGDFAGNVATDPGGAPGSHYSFHRVAGVEPGAPRLRSVVLSPSRPNPFRRSCEIRYGLPQECAVALEIYDLDGRRIARLASGRQGPGYASARWDGTSDAGARMPSGVYLCRLRAGGSVLVRKLLLAR